MRFKFLTENKISRLPKGPGVYCFKDKEGSALYIGKATNLRERVKNHFLRPGFRENMFLAKTKKVGFINTSSEIEALTLEAHLIKKYQPRYNVVWRDDKNYFFVGITGENFPRVFITHQPKQLKIRNSRLKVQYIGPSVDGKALKQVLKILRKVFPFRSCKQLPKRPCLWYQLGRCPAPCLLKTKLGAQILTILPRIKQEVQLDTKNLLRVLEGKRRQVLNDLKKGMKKAAFAEDFEKAAKIRDQVAALERVLAHAQIFESQPLPKANWQKIQKILQKILQTQKPISRIEAYDVSNIQGKEATGSMVTFLKGQPDKNFYRKFKIKLVGKPNDVSMIREILTRRFQHPEWPYPDLILIDGGRSQLNAAKKIEIKKGPVESKQPKPKMIKAMALAKKRNDLYIENQKEPILLKNLSREVFNLILQLRDEAHRFALAYHKKLRRRALIGRG